MTEHPLRSPESRNGKISSVGILTTQKVYSEFNLRGLISEYLSLEEVNIYSFANLDKKQEKSPECFTEDDLNWKGEIKDEALQSFRDMNFDLLICLYSKPHSMLDFIACTSSASFKVGLASKKMKFFDLEIHLESNKVDQFFEELKKYLIILQKL